jgi:ABC-type phosphate transport system permease subunit
MNFYIGLMFLNVFFVNSIVTTWRIFKKSENKEFWETLSWNIVIGVGSLSLALFFIGSVITYTEAG